MYDSDGERIRGGTHDGNHDDASEINCESNENNANEKLTNDFSETFRSFSNEVINRLHNDYCTSFTRSQLTLSRKNYSLFRTENQKRSRNRCFHLHKKSICQQKGRKKKGRLIGINSTSKSL